MRACFMEGPAGTGKTFTYNECLKELERRGVSHVATSFSGIASTLIKEDNKQYTQLLSYQFLCLIGLAATLTSTPGGLMFYCIHIYSL